MSAEHTCHLRGPNAAAGVRLTIHGTNDVAQVDWADLADLDWTEFSLVLGAGGVTGFAFEVGTLLALSTDHGVEFSRASALVGTSAGSIVASLLGLGFEPADLAAALVEADEHVSPELASLGVHFSDDVPDVPGPLSWFRWPSVGSTVAGVGHLLRRRFTAAFLNAMRDGDFDLAQRLDFLEEADWPAAERGLSVCAELGLPIVLDLAEVTFMDSSGLYVLLEGAQPSGDGPAPLRVGRVSDQVRRVFEITGTEHIVCTEHDQRHPGTARGSESRSPTAT